MKTMPYWNKCGAVRRYIKELANIVVSLSKFQVTRLVIHSKPLTIGIHGDTECDLQ
jgi:hypothetical protein